VKRILLVTTDAERIRKDFAQGGHPRVDFLELAGALDAEILSYSDLEKPLPFSVRCVRRLFGRDAALALLGFRQKADTYFTTAESAGIPLAFLLRFRRSAAAHVMISHMISAGKKKWLFKLLGLKKWVHGFIAYTSEQTRFAREWLGFDERALHLIQFHCDHRFFRPGEGESPERNGIVSVGRELRDYPTLIEAVRGLGVKLTIVGSSPWSKRKDLLAGLDIPPNVELRSGLSYEELRDLYASAALAVVPLQDVDSPAGVTSIFEALSMETPVIVTRTRGIEDSIKGCPGVFTAAPGDPAALRDAITFALMDRPKLDEVGRTGRESIDSGRSLDHFVNKVREIVLEV